MGNKEVVEADNEMEKRFLSRNVTTI